MHLIRRRTKNWPNKPYSLFFAVGWVGRYVPQTGLVATVYDWLVNTSSTSKHESWAFVERS